MTNYTISQIWRYPVKSMQGELLEEATLLEGGIPLDRGWAVKDEASGNISGVKKFGELLKCSARYIEGTSAGLVPHVEITLPDGSKHRSDDANINKTLSEFLKAEVTLWPLLPAENAEHFKLTMAEGLDPMESLRQHLGLEDDDPMPDFSKLDEKYLIELMEYSVPRGSYFDVYPISFMSEASLRKLQTLLPETAVSAERFRPNIVIEDDEGLEGTIEFEWVGKALQFGETLIKADAEAPRCIMTTREQITLPRAGEIMKTLIKEFNHNFAIYAFVEKAGEIKIGDKVALV